MTKAFPGKCLGCPISGYRIAECRNTSKADKERILNEKLAMFDRMQEEVEYNNTVVITNH